MTASIASRSGDSATINQILASGRLPPSEALKLMNNMVSLASAQHNYQQVVYWADRYQKAGGNEAAMRQTVIDAYFNLGRVPEAVKMQTAWVQAETRGGRAAPEVDLQRLYTYQAKAHDTAGQLATMKQLVTYYPKPLYWENVIASLRGKSGFASSRLLLQVYRLEFSLSLVNKPDEAMDMAAQSDHDGNALFALGDTYASYGMYDKGLPMMEQGLVKDDLRHPDDSKLELALAYWSAGQKAKAIAALKKVGGTDGTADLAQLWLLRFRQA